MVETVKTTKQLLLELLDARPMTSLCEECERLRNVYRNQIQSVAFTEGKLKELPEVGADDDVNHLVNVLSMKVRTEAVIARRFIHHLLSRHALQETVMKIMEATCPRCGAKPGEQCRTVSGAQGNIHASRKLVAWGQYDSNVASNSEQKDFEENCVWDEK